MKNRMRPNSAHGRSKEIKYPVSVQKNKSPDQSSSRYAHSSSNNLLEHKWEFRSQKMKFQDPKTIRLMHAYQPNKLKKCLIKNPKSMKQYYDNQGSCGLSRLSNNSFIKYYRQWRTNIREKLTNLITMVLQTEELDEQTFSMINQVLDQLKSICKEMLDSSKAICQSKNCPNVSQMKKIHDSFQNIDSYIKQLAPILHFLQKYIKSINKLLDQCAENPTQIKSYAKKIRKIHKQCQSKLISFIDYCHCHRQSSFVIQSEYKLKQKFDKISKGAIESLDNIAKKKQMKQKFIQKIKELMDKDFDLENFSVEILEEIAAILIENDRAIVDHFDENKENYTRAEKLINKLQMDIKGAQEQFLINFKYRSLMILREQLNKLQKITVLESLESKQNIWKQSKKKILLLSKIYSKERDFSYYEHLSACIKNTSQSYQNIQENIQTLLSISSDKQLQNRMQIERILRDLINYVLDFEKNKDTICEQIKHLIQKIGGSANLNNDENRNQKQNLESQRIKRLLFLLDYSANQTSHHLEMPNINQGDNNSKQSQSDKDIQNMLIKQTENNIRHMDNFNKHKITQLIDYSFELKVLTKDPLIDKVLLFEEDINQQALHSFQIVKKLYQVLLSHRKKKQKNKTQLKIAELQNLTETYEQILELTVEYRNSISLRSYLQKMFETHLAFLIIRRQKLVSKIIKLQINNTYPFTSKQKVYNPKQLKYSYHRNKGVKIFMNSQNQMLQNIVEACQKSIQYGALFDRYLQKRMKEISKFMKKWDAYYLFKTSQWNEAYYIGVHGIEQWIRIEFIKWKNQDDSKNQIISQDLILSVRHNTKKNVQKHLKILEKLYKQDANLYGFDQQFIKTIKEKISLINNYIVPLLPPNTKSYPEIIKNCLEYLRHSRIRHTAICAANEDPITFIPESIQSLDSITLFLERIVGLSKGSIEVNPANFTVLDINTVLKTFLEPFLKIPDAGDNAPRFLLDKSGSEDKKSKSKSKNQDDACFILPPPQMDDQKQEELGEDILDMDEEYDELKNEINQFIDSQIEEQSFEGIIEEDYDNDEIREVQSIYLGQKKESKKSKELSQLKKVISKKNSHNASKTQKSKDPKFILGDSNIQNDEKKQVVEESDSASDQEYFKSDLNQLSTISKFTSNNKNSFNPDEILKIQQNFGHSSGNPYVYYKLLKLPNLQLVRQFLKSSQHEFKVIKKSLKLQILAKALNNECSEQALKEQVQHLNYVLNISSQNSIVALFNVNHKYTKSQKIIADFRDCLIARANKNIREKKLNAVLQYLGVSYQPIYEGKNGDQIVMFKFGELSNYCHCNLTDQYPFILLSNEDHALQFQKLINLQILMLSQLLNPNKKKHIDKIQQLVDSINQELFETYADLKQRLNAHRQFMVDNGKQMDQATEQYYFQVTKSQLKLIPNYTNKSIQEKFNQYLRNLADIDHVMKIILHNQESPAKQLVRLKLVSHSYVPQNQPILILDSPKSVLPALSSPELGFPSPFYAEEQNNNYLNRESFSEYILDVDKYKKETLKSINKKIPPLNVNHIFQIILKDPNTIQAAEKQKILKGFKQRNLMIEQMENNEEYKSFMKIQPVILPSSSQKETVQYVIEKNSSEKQLIEKLTNLIIDQKALFIMEQPANKASQSQFVDMNRGMFILDNNKKMLPEHSSQQLQQLSDFLASSNVQHTRVIDKHLKTIGILKGKPNPEQVQSQICQSMNITSPSPFPIITDQLEDKGIVKIPNLYIYLVPIQENICKQFQENLIVEFLNQEDKIYTLQIASLSQKSKQKPKLMHQGKLNSLNISKEIPVECQYPHPAIAARLYLKQKNEVLWAGTIQEYEYGQKFLLKSVQDKIISDLQEFKIQNQKKERQQQEKRRLLLAKQEEEREQERRREEQRKKQLEKQEKAQRQEQQARKKQQGKAQFILGEQQINENAQQVVQMPKYTMSQGGSPRKLPIKQLESHKISKTKSKPKNHNKQTCQDSDDNLSQISITLSENANYQRKDLVECISYKFYDIEDLITEKRNNK